MNAPARRTATPRPAEPVPARPAPKRPAPKRPARTRRTAERRALAQPAPTPRAPEQRGLTLPGALARPARKAPTNLSLRIDLVQRAKALDLNLSDVVERALEKAIVEAEQARWLAENEAAIDYYNAFIEKHGMFGEEFRQF